MSEEELNAYRLTSLEKPTDEMLSAIMKEAADDAVQRWKNAEKCYFDQLRLEVSMQSGWQQVKAMQTDGSNNVSLQDLIDEIKHDYAAN